MPSKHDPSKHDPKFKQELRNRLKAEARKIQQQKKGKGGDSGKKK